MKSLYAVTVIIILILSLAGVVGPTYAQDATPATPGSDPVVGAQIYAENCAVCHGDKGQGRIGATLNDVFVSMNADVELASIITNGRAGTMMPAWGQSKGGPLSDEEIGDVIAFIESWGTTYEPVAPVPPEPRTPIPPAPQADGDPNKGYTIYQQNCAACHGENGEGRIGATLNTAFPSINPEAFAIETIRRGVSGTMMPAWLQANGGPLTDDEIRDVAAYVLSIQHAAAPPSGEVALPGNALPLILGFGLVIAVVVALALVQRARENKQSP